MTELRVHERQAGRATPRHANPERTLPVCVLAAWLLGSLLFAHGCHGDEDHELFTTWIAGTREEAIVPLPPATPPD